MAHWCAERGILHAPHGKTTMAPQLFSRQLDAGAWGITAATVSQARMFRAFGVQRILLANELVEPAALRWLADELAAAPELDFYCLADSVARSRRGGGALHREPATCWSRSASRQAGRDVVPSPRRPM
jgi:D-serine deaminase-like pyridoxal phosphate-dependent protein